MRQTLDTVIKVSQQDGIRNQWQNLVLGDGSQRSTWEAVITMGSQSWRWERKRCFSDIGLTSGTQKVGAKSLLLSHGLREWRRGSYANHIGYEDVDSHFPAKGI